MLRRHAAASIILALGLLCLSTTAVLAKDDIVATLDAAFPSDPEPGSEITVGWTLGAPVEGGTPVPFTAEGIFIRLIPTSGEPTETIATQDRPSHFVASAVVPDGGLQEIQIGVIGEQCVAGVCGRSDLLFAIDEPTRGAVAPRDAAAPEPPGQPGNQPGPAGLSTSGAPGASVDVRLVVAILVVVALLAGIGATMARGDRLDPRSSRS